MGYRLYVRQKGEDELDEVCVGKLYGYVDDEDVKTSLAILDKCVGKYGEFDISCVVTIPYYFISNVEISPNDFKDFITAYVEEHNKALPNREQLKVDDYKKYYEGNAQVLLSWC